MPRRRMTFFMLFLTYAHNDRTGGWCKLDYLFIYCIVNYYGKKWYNVIMVKFSDVQWKIWWRNIVLRYLLYIYIYIYISYNYSNITVRKKSVFLGLGNGLKEIIVVDQISICMCGFNPLTPGRHYRDDASNLVRLCLLSFSAHCFYLSAT